MMDVGALSAEGPAAREAMEAKQDELAQAVGQGLAERVAALRRRLEQMGLSPAREGADAVAGLHRLQGIQQQLAHLKKENRQLEASAAALPDAETPAPTRSRPLTQRARRLLLRGRGLLARLKELADHAETPDAPAEITEDYHQSVAMTEVVVRALHGLPDETGNQLRLCDGVEAIVGAVGERVAGLEAAIERRGKERVRVQTLAELLRTVTANRPADYKVLEALAEELIQENELGHPLRFYGPGLVSDPASWSAAHGLNTAQVAARVAFGHSEWAGRPVQPVLSALVHDAGMVLMPPEWLLHAGELTDERRRLFETHVAKGVEALERFAPAEAWLIDAVRCHHERLDGTGYPKGLKGSEIPKLARLLAVCDVYAALSNARPHRPALAPRTALTETLLEAEKGRLDSSLAEGLLELSFYPIGTVVELADGEVGVVAATNPLRGGPTTPARPVVHVLASADGRPKPWPTHVNLAQCSGRQIVRSLSPEEAQTALATRSWRLL